MEMRYRYLPAVIILLLPAMCLCGASTAAGGGIEVTDLRCEYLVNLRGIDVIKPRLSWRISEKGKSAGALKQIGYRVLVASSPELLAKDKGDLWDSEVKSDQSIHIVYGGKELTSRARCFWKVKVTHKKHLSVGMVGMLYLMQVLTDTGYPEVAYAIAAQKTRPSWGYMVSKGTTTIWERWDTDTKGPGMNSQIGVH